MLKPDPTTTNYYITKLLVPVSLPCREVEEGISEALIIVNNYNLLLYNAAATSAALLLMLYVELYKLLAILFLCFKNRRKMLVFDRPSIFPLTLVFLSYSPL